VSLFNDMFMSNTAERIVLCSRK